MIIIYCTAVILSAVLLYLFFIFPSVKKRFPRELIQKTIAHRGVHTNDCPENSLSAFKEAMRLGLPIELDVRLSRDGVPMVFHDKNLLRMCGVDLELSSVRTEELRTFTLGNSTEQIPTLTQVLDTLGGRVPLLIELKGEDKTDVARQVAQVVRGYEGVLAVESFNPYHLMRFRRRLPNIPLGLLSGRRIGKTPFTAFFGAVSMNMFFNFLFRPDFIAFRYTDRLPFGVKLCRKLGASLVGWTFCEKNAYYENSKNFDAVICDLNEKN